MSLSRDLTAVAQNQCIITVEGLEVTWHTMTGGGRSVAFEWDYSCTPPSILAGTVVADPIVLTTTVSLYRDLAWIRAVKRYVGHRTFTITRQWTDVNWDPVGEPEVYPDCLLVGYTNPESTPTTEDAQLALTFATAGEAL